MQRVTDRAIDFDGDGTEESQNNNANGTLPAGSRGSVVATTVDTDGGVDTTGDEHTEGVS